MKRQLIRIAIFVAVFFATAVLRGRLDSWLGTFELDSGAWLSLDSYVLFLGATPFLISFFLGGVILGFVAGTRRMAALWGMLLGGVFVAVYLAFSGLSPLVHLGAESFWQVGLSWANLWAPLAASVGGAVGASYLLGRARSQHAT